MTKDLKFQLRRNIAAYLIERDEKRFESRHSWKRQILELADLLGPEVRREVELELEGK
jgi:hypothetical protein